jgi:hypothetical protein
MKFNKELLDELGELLCEKLKLRLESGNATASDFNATINLLRNNGVIALPSTTGALTDTLLEQADEDLLDSIPDSSGDHYSN